MATVAIATFLPHISPKVLGCPDPLIYNALRSAAFDFCSRSEIWSTRLAAASVTSADFPYSIPTDAHAQAVRLLSARCDGASLTETSYDALDSVEDWDTETGTPANYLFNEDDKLVVYPLPSGTSTLRLRVVLAPARGAELIDATLDNKWREALASGAIALLCAEPNKPWSNAEQYAYHNNIFEQGVRDARIEARRRMTTGNISVAMRPAA